jgi:hypothetical protein
MLTEFAHGEYPFSNAALSVWRDSMHNDWCKNAYKKNKYTNFNDFILLFVLPKALVTKMMKREPILIGMW